MALNPDVVNESGALIAVSETMQTMPSILKLDHIKCPSGGGMTYKLMAIDGAYSAEEFEGVIIKVLMGRKFWRDKYTGRGTPPDCMSVDTITGSGNPGGRCSKCQMNEFDPEEKVKKCREFRTVILLTPDSMMPKALSVPVTSIDNLTKYTVALGGGGKRKDGSIVLPKPYYGVVTTFGLESDKSQGGVEYSKMTFKMNAELSKEQIGMIREIKKIYDPILEELNERNGGGEDYDPADEDE